MPAARELVFHRTGKIPFQRGIVADFEPGMAAVLLYRVHRDGVGNQLAVASATGMSTLRRKASDPGSPPHKKPLHYNAL